MVGKSEQTVFIADRISPEKSGLSAQFPLSGGWSHNATEKFPHSENPVYQAMASLLLDERFVPTTRRSAESIWQIC